MSVACATCFELETSASAMQTCFACSSTHHIACDVTAVEPATGTTSWHCGCPLKCMECGDGASVRDILTLQCFRCMQVCHAHCVRPTLYALPAAESASAAPQWCCSACVKCTSCNRRTPGDYFGAQWHNGYTTCERCEFDGNKYICGICDKSWDPNKNVLWISCDWCKLWYHAACDNINKFTLKKMTKDDKKYACVSCRPSLSESDLASAYLPEGGAAVRQSAKAAEPDVVELGDDATESRRKRRRQLEE